jgi:indolepyruvate ferredoxin oxidoreductase alpha subunit
MKIGCKLPCKHFNKNTFIEEFIMPDMMLLGNEAVAMGAIDAGISAAYAYPGTPSTEITEFLVQYAKKEKKPIAEWCANEKTAFEAALGVSYGGKRALVSMKHVGLNVAADPFMSASLVTINGGFVIAVADDPGMHGSQNEQDSRYFADFAKILCLEPSNQQEAYEMTREAFDLSELYKIPIMIRLVTRLSHSRSTVKLKKARAENKPKKAEDPKAWTLLPINARKQWRSLLEKQKEMNIYSETTEHNALTMNPNFSEFGVITTGLAQNYFLENLPDLKQIPPHLHISVYPFPAQKIIELAENVKSIVILEEGYPYVERFLSGILPQTMDIFGKTSGHVPLEGELNPDNVRPALYLSENKASIQSDIIAKGRPPQLCEDCPHIDSFDFIKLALEDYPESITMSDTGCYTLGALPPYNAIETTVNMGASIGLAKGAADAGFHPVIAVIGDSTFIHSGIAPLIDAIASKVNITVLIFDNQTTAMSGGQPIPMPSSQLESLVRGTGVEPGHIHILHAEKNSANENVAIIKKELEYQGVSVIIMVRECVITAKRAKKRNAKNEI